jgi:hypothetical protein
LTSATGVTAKLVDSQIHGDHVGTLYWIQPVQVDGQLRHARIAMILFEGEDVPAFETAAPPADSPAAVAWRPVQSQLESQGLATDTHYGAVNQHLALLGTEVVAAMVERASAPAGAPGN